MSIFYDIEHAPKDARIIVCGGRTYAWPHKLYDSREARQADLVRVNREEARLFAVLSFLRPRSIANGDAPGADKMSYSWAKTRRVPCALYPAFWTEEGRAAGPKRNRRMFTGFEPEGVVAFPGGDGTADMVSVAVDGGAWIVKVDW